MAQLNTSAIPNIVTLRGIDMVIQHDWDNRAPVGRTIFNVRNSSQYQEDVQTVGGVGLFSVKPEGTSVNYQNINDGFRSTFTHITYALGMRITHEMMSDELYGVMEGMGKELAASAAATEEALLASHFNNATSTSYKGADGVPLFSASHVREDGTTYSNTTDTDLSKAALETGLIAFRNFRDGGGKRLNIKPATLLIPPDLIFTASRLLQSEYNPVVNNTASDDGPMAANPLNALGIKIVPWDYMTETDMWALLAPKSQHKLIMYDREAFGTDYIYDFDTGDYKIKGQFRMSSGWADPRGIYGSY